MNTSSPREQIKYFVGKGFAKLEIDIYALSRTTYKFCHPVDKDKVSEIHDINDGYLHGLIREFPSVEWYVDLKCRDLDEVPKEMLPILASTFGTSAVFIAAQHEILDFMHEAGIRTAQYFRDNKTEDLLYEPNFYMQNSSEKLRYPKERMILFCDDLESAFEYQATGFSYIMTEGSLIASLR